MYCQFCGHKVCACTETTPSDYFTLPIPKFKSFTLFPSFRSHKCLRIFSFATSTLMALYCSQSKYGRTCNRVYINQNFVNVRFMAKRNVVFCTTTKHTHAFYSLSLHFISLIRFAQNSTFIRFN